MKKVKIGVIGCGVIGRLHMQILVDLPNTELVAVADLNEQSAHAAAKKFNAPAVYTDGFALIDDPEVEAVILGLPTSARMEFALHTIKQEKHLLVEKPGGMDASEVDKLIEARGVPVVASCCSRFRYLESAKVLKDFIKNGALGELRSIRIRYIQPAAAPPANPPYWRYNRRINGGGIMANWGTYDLDYLLGITDWKLKPKDVLAQAWTVPDVFRHHVAKDSDAETHIKALIRCEGGTMISFERGECITSKADNSWEMIGTLGALTFEMVPDADKEIWFHEADPDVGVIPKLIWRGDDEWDTTNYGVVKDFAEAILESRPPTGTLEQARLIQQMIDAMYTSSELQQTVTLSN